MNKNTIEVLKKYIGCQENGGAQFCAARKTCDGCEYDYLDAQLLSAVKDAVIEFRRSAEKK